MNKKIVKETFSQSVILLIFSQIIVKSLGMIYKLYLTNKPEFGDEGNAIFSAGFQVYTLVLSIIAIGIPNAISKLVAERSSIGDNRGAYKIFKIALFIFSMLGILGSYILIIYSERMSNEVLKMPEAQLSIIMFAPSIFLVSIISVFKGYFGGRQNLKSVATAQSLDQVTKTVVTIILIELSIYFSQNENTKFLSACAAFATTIGNIVELGFLYKFYRNNLDEIKEEIGNSINFKPIRNFEIIKDIMKVAIPIELVALIISISRNIDSTSIVGGLQEKIGYDEAKRQYGILSGKVESLVNFPLAFNMSIATALLPNIASAKNDQKQIERKLNQSLLYGLLISIPTTAVFFLYSNEILSFLFPKASLGGNILQISCFSIIFLTIEQIAIQILQARGKNKVPVIAIIIGVVVKIILNKILVPNIDWKLGGTQGAAFATLCCNLVSCIIVIISVLKETKAKISIKTIGIPILISSIFIIVTKLMYNILSNQINYSKKFFLILSFLFGILVYLLLLLKLKVINASMIKNAKKAEK